MALQPNELFTSNTEAAKLRIFSTSTQPKGFAAGAVTLAKGIPVAFDTVAAFWKVWANAGGNETNLIRGFVWADDIVLAAGGEVIGNVMLAGRIHAADVGLPAGENQGDLDAALAAGLRERTGIIVEGLVSFH